MCLGWFYFRLYFDSSWSFVLLIVIFFKSKLIYSSYTYAFFDVNFFEFATVEVIIKHGFKIGIMSFIARSIIVDGIGEEGVETKTD